MKPFILFSLIAVSGAALAAHDPVYVPPTATNAAQILMAPAAPDSASTREELAELHRIEAARTPAEVERARADEGIETLFIYQSVLGPRFNAAALPLTAALAKHVSNDEGVNSTPGKLAFNRVRPYNVDATLHPVCKTKTKNDSYPSGHATAGYLGALVLIEMVPEQRDAILARAGLRAQPLDLRRTFPERRRRRQTAGLRHARRHGCQSRVPDRTGGRQGRAAPRLGPACRRPALNRQYDVAPPLRRAAAPGR